MTLSLPPSLVEKRDYIDRFPLSFSVHPPLSLTVATSDRLEGDFDLKEGGPPPYGGEISSQLPFFAVDVSSPPVAKMEDIMLIFLFPGWKTGPLLCRIGSPFFGRELICRSPRSERGNPLLWRKTRSVSTSRWGKTNCSPPPEVEETGSLHRGRVFLPLRGHEEPIVWW